MVRWGGRSGVKALKRRGQLREKLGWATEVEGRVRRGAKWGLRKSLGSLRHSIPASKDPPTRTKAKVRKRFLKKNEACPQVQRGLPGRTHETKTKCVTGTQRWYSLIIQTGYTYAKCCAFPAERIMRMQGWYPEDTRMRNAFMQKTSPSRDKSFSFRIFAGDTPPFVSRDVSRTVLRGAVTVFHIFTPSPFSGTGDRALDTPPFLYKRKRFVRGAELNSWRIRPLQMGGTRRNNRQSLSRENRVSCHSDSLCKENGGKKSPNFSRGNTLLAVAKRGQ